MDDFKIILQAIIDNSSLDNIQKQLATEKLKATVDIDADLEKFAKSNQKIEDMMERLADKISIILEGAIDDKQAMQWAKQYYKQMSDGAKQAAKEQEKLNALRQKETLKNQEQQYKRRNQLEKERLDIQRKIVTASGQERKILESRLSKNKSKIDRNRTYIETHGLKSNELERKVQNSVSKGADDVNTALAKELDKIYQNLNKLEKEWEQQGIFVDEFADKVRQLKNILNGVKLGNQLDIEANTKEIGTAKNILVELTNATRTYVTAQQRLTKANAIEAFLQKNTRITKEAKYELEQYIRSLRDVDTAMSKVAKNNIDIRFKEIENSMRGLHKLGYAFSDQMKQAATSFAQWISVSNLIMSGIYRTREAVNELIEVDNILTEISKTSDMTKQELIALGDTSFETASKLGRNATDYLNTVMDMSRSGFYGEQGEAMAKQVLLAQTAGDLSQELASNYVIATNAAYKFGGDVEKINEVIDGANLITNRYSVAMADMAESMSIAGTVAASYRVNPDELSAMTGVIESVTKLGGNEVGNALKAILINLQNITSSKIVGTLSKAGASMTEVVNGVQQMRDPVEILKDLAVTFNSLDEKDPLRAEILTNIGQKYHAQKLAALLSNMDKYDEMLVTYAQGTGSAAIEAEKSANNIQGSLNRLSNTWTDIINNMLSSDTMLLGINTLNKFLTLINSATSALGDLGSIGMLATGVASAKGYGLNHSL